MEHVKEGDTYKEKRYREAIMKPQNPRDNYSLFVKTGENHTIWGDRIKEIDSKNDIKPRIICCPSYTIRARIGLASYNVLKYLKKKYK